MNSTSKPLIPLLGLAGIVAAVGLILYLAGFRITSPTTPSTGQQQARQPGQHARRQAMAEGQTGQGQQAGSRERQNQAARQRDPGRKTLVQAGALGAEQITVIANGKERSFTGTDLEKLEKTTIASNRGARAGWQIANVMNHLSIPHGKELVLVAKDGKRLDLPWEKAAGVDPTMILTYNQFGGLMLISGKKLTAEELQNLDNRTVRTAAQEYHATQTFLANIVKIEVKS